MIQTQQCFETKTVCCQHLQTTLNTQVPWSIDTKYHTSMREAEYK